MSIRKKQLKLEKTKGCQKKSDQRLIIDQIGKQQIKKYQDKFRRVPMLFEKCMAREKTQEEILNNVGECQKHQKPFSFICLQQSQFKGEDTCEDDRLMCPDCLADHKGHSFEALEDLFTLQFRQILRSKKSLNGPAVARLKRNVIGDLDEMLIKITSQISNTKEALVKQFEQLEKKYPINDNFGIPDNQINPNNIKLILKIMERQRNHVWVPSVQQFMRNTIAHTSTIIENFLQQLQQKTTAQPYESFDSQQAEKRIQQFYEENKQFIDKEGNYFRWSQQQKHENIKVHDEGLSIKYFHNSPSKPAIFTTNPFTKEINRIYFKIIKMPTSILIFDASLVAIGAGLPITAKIFGYRQLIEPSHGAFMIGSNGKTYHSSLQKYNKKSLSFTFTQGQCILMQIDYTHKMVLFSKWGFFERHFSMQLTVKDEDLLKLKPCLMFHGDVGAMVKIVDDDIYKNKKIEEKNQI